MEFLFAKELFTYCKYVLFVHTIPKVPTEISFGIGMVNTKKYQPIPTGKYQFGIQLYKFPHSQLKKHHRMHQMLSKGCPKSQSSIDLGHFLTLWLVPIWEVLGRQKKSIIMYLRRVPNNFFHLESLIFHRCRR
jgi:hypothetical protein